MTINNIESALAVIDATDRDTWIKIGMAIKSELGDQGFAIWDRWSQTADNYNKQAARSVWRSFKSGGITIASLFHEAKQNGWQPDLRPALVAKNLGTMVPKTPRNTGDTRQRARKAWKLATPAPANHPYLIKKQIEPHGIGVLGSHYRDAPKLVQGDGNLLVVPLIDLDGYVWSCQFIGESVKKAYMKGPRNPGTFYWIEGNTEHVYICEGFATGATIRQETGHAVACAFDAYHLVPVAQTLATRFINGELVIMADDDWQTPNNPGKRYAEKAAKETGAILRCPDFEGLPRDKKDSDYNDAMRLRGGHGQD